MKSYRVEGRRKGSKVAVSITASSPENAVELALSVKDSDFKLEAIYEQIPLPEPAVVKTYRVSLEYQDATILLPYLTATSEKDARGQAHKWANQHLVDIISTDRFNVCDVS